MATKTKIKKDFLGLYVNCGGYISRPFYGTSFNEGDVVNTHHFGGSTMAGVTSIDKKETHHFKKNGKYEYWGTTGISPNEHKDKIFNYGYEKVYGGTYSTFEEFLKLNTEWYSKLKWEFASTYKEHNENFQK